MNFDIVFFVLFVFGVWQLFRINEQLVCNEVCWQVLLWYFGVVLGQLFEFMDEVKVLVCCFDKWIEVIWVY